MFSNYFNHLFSRTSKTREADVKKLAELAKCRFFVDAVHPIDAGVVGLQGLVQRGRVYTDESLELVGYGAKVKIQCHQIWKGRRQEDYAWEQVHFDPFVLGVKYDDLSIFRKGQVVAAAGSACNVLRCKATVEITGTPGNLGKPLSQGFKGNIHFRQAIIYAAIILPDDHIQVMPGETVNLQINLSEQLPLEPGDQIQISYLGSIFGNGQVNAITPID